MEIHNNFSLKEFNTFKLEAKASQFIFINTINDIKELSHSELINNKELFILGGGSNILFTKDFKGTVIHSKIQGVEILNDKGTEIIVKVGSGMVWDDLVEYCVLRNWGGLENLSDIPGCVGAAPVQNIGAYGVEARDSIVQVEAFDLNSMELINFTNEQCQFGYRNSYFKKANNLFITNVHFRLIKDSKPNSSYGNLQQEFEKHSEKSIQNLRKAVIKIRRSKLPPVDELGSAGSFFKNPLISNREFSQLLKEFPTIPSYKQNDSKIKIPAAWLIEHTGLKGFRMGNASTHIMQPLVIVNLGEASGQNIVALAEHIQESVSRKFGIKLEPEVCII